MSTEAQKRYQVNEQHAANQIGKNPLVQAAVELQAENDELKTKVDLLQTKLIKSKQITDARKVSNVKANQRKTPTRYGGSR